MEDEIAKRPSNCEALSPVECNVQVLDALITEAKKSDFCLKEVSKDITKAANMLVQSRTILDKLAQDDKNSVLAQEVTMLNGALALLGCLVGAWELGWRGRRLFALSMTLTVVFGVIGISKV